MNKPLRLQDELKFFMKVTLLHTLITCTSVMVGYAINTNGQELLQRHLTIKVENESLQNVFTTIEQKVNARFTYDMSLIKGIDNITLAMEDVALQYVLAEILGNKINYLVKGDQIILLPEQEIAQSETDVSTEDKTAIQKVSGTVKDESATPIPGVNVLIKGTTLGTTTDAGGNFSLDIEDENSILVFSFIGYISQELTVGSQTTFNVKLLPDIKALSEVIVVGYGEAKKETLTGSIATVKGKDILQSPATNVSNSLAGRLPGLVTLTTSGEPGYDGTTLRVRGVNSLGNSDPLIVVDGVPGRSLDRIDPNSIESITLLKDASAAIYGAQAANGVIIITTKRGKLGKPEIVVTANQGYGQPTRIPKMANAPEYATMLNEIQTYRGRTPQYTPEQIQKFADGSDPWNYPNSDWFGATLRKWSSQNYANLQVSGGSENMKYFVSAGAKSQDGYYISSATKYNQYDFRSNLDGKISNHVKLSVDLAGRLEDRNFPTRGSGQIFRMLMRGLPTSAAIYPNGLPGPDLELGDNPVVIATNQTGYNNDKWYYLQSNIRLVIDVPWVKGLSVTTNASVDKGFRFRKQFQKPWYLYSYDAVASAASGDPVMIKTKKGVSEPSLQEDTEDNTGILLNTRMDYEKTFNVHSIKIMAGAERRTWQADRFNAYRRYFVSDQVDQMFAGGDLQKNNGGTAEHEARLNYFGRVNYSYSEKYLVEFIWRYDGSFIFPAGKRFGFFPSVSAGWRISEEKFWANIAHIVPSFKLRASWGQTGNDRIDRWQYLSSYGFNPNNWTYVFGVNQENKRLYEARIPNPNVTWERANQTDIGIDATLFHDRIAITADYFNYTRTDLLWFRNASIPTSAGLTLPRENIGKVANKGYDFSVTYNNEIGKFSYSVGVNGGYQKNKVVFMDETPNVPQWQRATGRPIPTAPSNNPNDAGNDLYYQADGIFKDQAQVDSYAAKWPGARPGDIIFKDIDGDGQITANDRVRIDKSNIPKFTGGMSVNLRFKGFDLAILLQGASGAVRYMDTESGDNGNFLKEYYDKRWTADNPNGGYPRTHNRGEEYWKGNRNTFWLMKTDYLRLKNLQLGYTIPTAIVNRVKVRALRIYVSGQNLLTYTPDLKDFDPELSSSSGQSYPLQKIINGGLTLTF